MEVKEIKKKNHNRVKELVIILVGVLLLAIFSLRADAEENDWTGTFESNGNTYVYYYTNYYHTGYTPVSFSTNVYVCFVSKGNTANFWTFSREPYTITDKYSTSTASQGTDDNGDVYYTYGGNISHGTMEGVTINYPQDGDDYNSVGGAFVNHYFSEDFVGYVEPLPDLDEMLSESNYGLKNFYADNKINANWVGMYYNNRINEHIGLNIEFSYRGKNSDFIEVDTMVYDNDFSIEDLSFYIPWDDVCGNDENYYLRSMHVTPIGKDSEGNYIHGATETVFYDSTGKLTDISAVQNSLASQYDDIVHGGASSRFGTKILTDFYLKNVVVKRGILSSNDVVKWEGCTNNIDYLTVPDKDTLVICSVILYDSNGDIYVEDYDSTTIGSGSMRVDWNKLYEKYKDSEYLWTGEIRLAPCYVMGQCLFIGQQTSIDIFQGIVLNEGIDEDGEFVIEDVTDSNISDSNKDSIFDNASDFLNDTESISKYTSLFFGFLTNLVSLMGQVPDLFGHVFSFLPSIYSELIGMAFILALVCRILGR